MNSQRSWGHVQGLTGSSQMKHQPWKEEVEANANPY